MNIGRKWYQRSGFACLDDFKSSHWKEVFRRLEQAQSDFLSRKAEFRSPEYRWPDDALHFVSRPWEYAYVFSHLKDWKANNPEIKNMKVMDFGSGLTFLPFALAKENMSIVAVDIDPVAHRDFGRAKRITPVSPGNVDFLLSSNQKPIPVENESFDCVYSISVLEHIPDPIPIIKELNRALKPEGLFALTFDVCLQGGGQIAPGPFTEMMNFLRAQFELVWPEQCVHPSTMLTCYNGPYPYPLNFGRSISDKLVLWTKRVVKERILGSPRLDVAFFGLVLKKKDRAV